MPVLTYNDCQSSSVRLLSSLQLIDHGYQNPVHSQQWDPIDTSPDDEYYDDDVVLQSSDQLEEYSTEEQVGTELPSHHSRLSSSSSSSSSSSNWSTSSLEEEQHRIQLTQLLLVNNNNNNNNYADADTRSQSPKPKPKPKPSSPTPPSSPSSSYSSDLKSKLPNKNQTTMQSTLLSSSPTQSRRHSYQSSALSIDNEDKLVPRQRQLTGETSSYPSDNEISSLYGKYRHSGYSINEPSDHIPLDDTDTSQQHSFTQGDDADGLVLARKSSGVIDELNRMLGEAIDSAQTHLGDNNNNTLEASTTTDIQPQLSTSLTSHTTLVNPLARLGIEEDSNSLHPPEAIIHQPAQHSTEDLSEPITSSSVSNYSADLVDDSKGQHRRHGSSNLADLYSVSTIDEPPNIYSAYDDDVASKSQDGLVNKEFSESPVFAIANSAACSEEVLSTSAIEESDAHLHHRSPSQKKRDPIILGKNLQDLVSSHKQHTLQDTRESIASSDQSQTHIPITPLEELTSLSTTVLPANPTRSFTLPPKKLFEEDPSLHKQLAQGATPQKSGKTFVARSPVVKRSSSDVSFLEQWQWLEAQHPSNNTPLKKKQSSPTAIKASYSNTPPNSREKCIQVLNDHFRSPRVSAESKMAALIQRQRSLQQSHQRPNHANNNNRSVRLVKQAGEWFERVPTIDPKELRKLKTTADRCRVYEAKLQQLYSQPMGLDLWVWLKTCGESPSNTSPSLPLPSTDSRSALSQTRKPGYSPLMNAHQPPLSSLPTYFQQSGNSVPVAQQPRDTSMSSVASFPLRSGTSSQKAIQIKRSSENQLVEIIHPEGAGGRSHGMIVNSLMEVNNLPYPSLYTHSVGQNLGIHQTSSSTTDHQHNKLGASSSRATASESSSSKGGRFFSQITRQQSSKRRNHSASASSSPSKGSLVISAPLLGGGGARHATPRGPRPEQQHGPGVKTSGTDLKALFLKSHDALTSSTTSRQSHEDVRLPSPRVSGTQRMSFAYGSALRNPTSAANSAFSPHRSRLAPHHLQHQGHPTAPPPRRPSADTPSDRPAHYISKHPQLHLPPTPATATAPLDFHHHHPDNVILQQKLDKLSDILPSADRNVLRQILLDNQLDDIVSIGCYLEMTKK